MSLLLFFSFFLFVCLFKRSESESEEVYSQPLSLVPGTNFRGVVTVFGGGGDAPFTMEIFFDLDIIDDWIEKYDVKGSCTCTWAETDPDDCCCGLVAIELRVRQDAHTTLTEVGNDLFPKDALVAVRVIAGRVRTSFETLNRHIPYDYPCDNFRVHPQMSFANDFLTLSDVFFTPSGSSSSEDDLSDFVDR